MPSTQGDALLLTTEETAMSLKVSERTVWRLISSGDLESVKLGDSRRVPKEALEAFVQRLRAAAVSDRPDRT